MCVLKLSCVLRISLGHVFVCLYISYCSSVFSFWLFGWMCSISMSVLMSLWVWLAFVTCSAFVEVFCNFVMAVMCSL